LAARRMRGSVSQRAARHARLPRAPGPEARRLRARGCPSSGCQWRDVSATLATHRDASAAQHGAAAAASQARQHVFLFLAFHRTFQELAAVSPHCRPLRPGPFEREHDEVCYFLCLTQTTSDQAKTGLTAHTRCPAASAAENQCTCGPIACTGQRLSIRLGRSACRHA
jgi:hypothetical protein